MESLLNFTPIHDWVNIWKFRKQLTTFIVLIASE